MKKLTLALIAAMILITSCQKQDGDRELPGSVSKTKDRKIEFFNEGVTKKPVFEPNVLLVGLKDNNATSRVFAKNPVMRFINTMAMQKKGYHGINKIHSENIIEDSIKLAQDPNVAWVSRNWAVYTQSIPDDPYYNSTNLWGAFAINQAAALSHGNYGSESILVGIIDEPLLNCHEDLKDQVWTNPYEIDGNGIDDDKNGYIDDVTGYNFVTHTNNIYMGPTLSHGTHVAGTIGARGGNQKGVIGVSPYVTMIPAPFLGLGGGYLDDAVEATDYLTGLKLLHPELKISHSSNSWGGGGYSQAMKDALDRAAAADIGFIAAAGNSSLDNDAGSFYPANYGKICPNVIAVGASDWGNNRASFSNYGKTSVHVFAPGTQILSTVPYGSGYDYKSGTSMATPQVSGAAALLKAAHPDWTFLQIKAALIASVTKVPALTDYCQAGGILNLNDPIFFVPTPAVQAERECRPWELDVTPPSRPTNFRLYGGLNQWPGWGVSADGTGYFFVTADPELPGDGAAGNVVYIDGPNYTLYTPFPGGTTGMPLRSYDMYCRRYDVAGNYSDTSNHIHFTLGGDQPPPPPPPAVDDVPPVVTITSPEDGYQIPLKGNKNVKINFTATDNIGVTSRQIVIDGAVMATNASTYQWNANKASKGNHIITCKAFDAAGNEGTKSVTVIKL